MSKIVRTIVLTVALLLGAAPPALAAVSSAEKCAKALDKNSKQKQIDKRCDVTGSQTDVYNVFRPATQSHGHLLQPGQWAGQTFLATTPFITEVWVNLTGDPVDVTVELIEWGTGQIVTTGSPSYSYSSDILKAVFPQPVPVTGGYYLLRVTASDPLNVFFSNYDDYTIGDGRLHDTGNCCVHGHDLNARIIGLAP